MTEPTHPSMLPRFEGQGGKVRLADVLKRQVLVNGDSSLANALAEKAMLVEVNPGDVITHQGGTDTDLYFIVSGSVAVRVNDRIIASRAQGTHFGELALVDQMVRRSATVVAQEPCVLARVLECDFSAIAANHPQLWRCVAIEIANRLRERSRYIRQPHSEPVLFVGSASEQLDIARAIQAGLAHDPFLVTVWTDGVFTASRTTIESLIAAVSEADFAVVVVSPDDLVDSRGVEQLGPRDNVLFELGLFMGGIGRERTYVVRPRGSDMKIPTDLLGVTFLDYVPGNESTLASRIAPVCTQLRGLITRIGAK